jgi:hypothetical protein
MKWSHWMCTAAMLFLAAQTSILRGAITCATSDYNGTYAFNANGALVTLPPAGAALVGTFAQAGTFTSDGQGNVTIQAMASYNGLILPAGIPGTYAITPDCTITFSVTLPPPLGAPATFTGVLASNNRQMALTITSPPGTVVIGEHYKQDSRFCSIKDLSGAYQLDLDGAISAPKALVGVYHLMGRMVADGAGGFTAATANNYNGNLVTESVSGTYTVDASCNVTMAYTAGAGSASPQSITMSGAIAGHGEVVPMMITTSGYAAAGLLRAQQY